MLNNKRKKAPGTWDAGRPGPATSGAPFKTTERE